MTSSIFITANGVSDAASEVDCEREKEREREGMSMMIKRKIMTKNNEM
jgi:hypothetical protein